MNVRCYGFGFVGKAYAMLIREQGHSVQVKTADDDTRWEAISKGFGGFTNLYMMSLVGADYDAIVISVPTPTIKNKQDLKVLESILKEIKENHETPYIIIKSTVLPSNITELEKKYRKKGQKFILYPEFLEAKNPIGGVFNQTCCVFGKRDAWSPKEKEFLSALLGLTIPKMTFTNLATASMLKYIHNMWLSCNLSFWNSVMRATKRHDIDYDLVLKETHKSSYFGRHPWAIGTAYGGTCLPKDIKAFVSSIKKDGKFKKFIQMIDDVNEEVLKNE